MTRSVDTDKLFTDLNVDQYSNTLERDDAYSALLDLLDHIRDLGQHLVTIPELWTTLRSFPDAEKFGTRARMLTLLATAERDHMIRRTPTGRILLRLDAPSCGGPEHVWIRLDGRSASEVEIAGADPWPDHQLHAPGPAWWRCTGCRTTSGIRAQDFQLIREQATEHASTCRALPAPPACH
ncbi:hypothetical protein ACFYPC_36800 [Streptomyces sp. NPDC005808]|uniref:hypothetical protein n=1 Tax=Streptomyces sp. NPDC005808 TaxID=3364734 RepID=UPI00367ACD73